MFDQEYGGLVSATDFGNAIGGLLLFLRGQSGNGLVEKKQSRFHGQGPAHLDSLLNTERTVRDPGLPVRLKIQKLDDLFHRLALS